MDMKKIMRNLFAGIASLIMGGLSFYAMSTPVTPNAIWIKFAVFIVVSLVVYLILKPKK